jgi:hypothetical protein
VSVKRELRFADEAKRQLEALGENPKQAGLYKQVLKTLGFLELDTRHPGLHTHQYTSLIGAKGEEVWETYAQNKTSGAYRVFFHYGPDEKRGKARVAILTVIAITPHP